MYEEISATPNPTDTLRRETIDAPPEFVSVYHETVPEALDVIAQEGLHAGAEGSGIGSGDGIVSMNKQMDDARPPALVEAGISRCENVYAYPFLHEGHGLFGADQRFVTSNQGRDKDSLKREYPGKILELKVDPRSSFVGDLGLVTDAFADIRNGYGDIGARHYWSSMVTLEDFLRWYRIPTWSEDGNHLEDEDQYREGEFYAGGYIPLKDAPENLPSRISQPEILVPGGVPQEHLRLVTD